jgi:glucosamine-6-phosphate deaminase
MEIIIQANPQTGAAVAARMVAKLIREKPNAVLGLATGSTPLGLYRELVRLHKEDGLDFSAVTTFNLDEYIGLSPDHPESYHRFMFENLFDHINVARENIHIPDGMTSDVAACCKAYEQAIQDAGGIDLQVLGIGTDGHVGFNEPSSSLASRTRIKTLTQQTLSDNARFFDDPAQQPHHVLTMGIGTIMESRQVVMLAFGENKAEAIAKSLEGPVCAMMPASVLQFHERAHVILDDASSAGLKKADYYRWVYQNKPEWQQH